MKTLRASRYSRFCFALALGIASFSASAAITLTAQDARVFEGGTGSHQVTFNVTTSGTSGSSSFRLNVFAVGTGLLPAAVGGATCAAGIDFITVTNLQWTVGPNGTFAIPVTICGNATVQSIIFAGGTTGDRQFAVSLTPIDVPTNSELPVCGRCTAFITIVDDDGPPSMAINNISVSEPFFSGQTKTATFTVTLHHPSTQEIRAQFATRDGTAKGRTLTSAFFDYFPASGTLIIPASTASVTNLTGTIGVTIVGDKADEPDERFFVDLTAPVNATIGFGTGIATIHDTNLTLGGFEVSPADASVQVGEPVQYYVDWTVPAGRVWRSLRTIDFRIRGGKTVLWVRWDEPTNLISLCRKSKKGGKDDDDSGDDGPGPDVECTDGGLPGGTGILETDFARLRLAESTVVGSGLTGLDVTLGLLVEFLDKAEGHHYNVELAATDDFGGVDRFVRAAEVEVEKVKKH